MSIGFHKIRSVKNRRQRKYYTTSPGKLKCLPSSGLFYLMHYAYGTENSDELAFRQVHITFYEHAEPQPHTRMFRVHNFMPWKWKHRKHIIATAIYELKREIK